MLGIDYLKNYLRNEGFRFEEQDTFISFKFQGVNYIAFKNDSPFLQLMIMCNTKDKSRNQCLEVCNELNSNRFVVKCTVVESNNVWCSYEFKPSEKTSADEFAAILGYLDKASDELLEKLS